MHKSLATALERYGAPDALFSLKCFAAAALAYYLALIFQFPKPFWALMTSYIVANPLVGAVHSKARFRLAGTAVGAAIAIFLLTVLRGTPEMLTLALACWLGLCIYLAVLDRTARAYMYLLCGFTAVVITMPIIDRPETVFLTAVVRVEEIALGFLSAGLVHTLILPRSVSDRLLVRVDAIVRDAEQWSIDTLDHAGNPRLSRDRRKLALDIAELHQLSVHLPFDTGRRRLRLVAVRALQQQLAILAPLAAAVDDRLRELSAIGPVPPHVTQIVEDARTWLDHGDRAGHQVDAQALRRRIRDLEPGIEPGMASDRLQMLGLLVRLEELVEAHAHCRDLRNQLRAPMRAAVSETVPALLARTAPQVLHQDRGLALRSGLNAVATFCILTGLWRWTSWPNGDGAVMIAAICCSLFAGFDQPAALLNKFLAGWVIATLLSFVYAFVILPRVTDFALMLAVLAPYLLFCGSLLARQQTALLATGLLLGLLNTMGFNEQYSAQFASFSNVALGQVLGAVFAVLMLRLFTTIGAPTSAQRIIRANWRDIGRFDGTTVPSLGSWIGISLDRIGLLAPRLTASGEDSGGRLLAALGDLRAGGALLRLRTVQHQTTGEDHRVLSRTAGMVAAHYRQQAELSRPVSPDPALVAVIDDGIARLAALPPAQAKEGVLALLTLHRVLLEESRHGHTHPM